MFQINVRIDDNSSPNKFTTGIVYVNVPRDLFAPVLNLPRTVAILENTQPGTLVFDVDATDQDQKVGIFLYMNLIHIHYHFAISLLWERVSYSHTCIV
jgi:hypothetical protein